MAEVVIGVNVAEAGNALGSVLVAVAEMVMDALKCEYTQDDYALVGP